MKRKRKLVFRISCDDQFVERFAKEDPFEYANRVILPATKADIRFADGASTDAMEDVDVVIEETGETPYNYKLTYTYLVDSVRKGDYVGQALMNMIGVENLWSFERVKHVP